MKVKINKWSVSLFDEYSPSKPKIMSPAVARKIGNLLIEAAKIAQANAATEIRKRAKSNKGKR